MQLMEKMKKVCAGALSGAMVFSMMPPMTASAASVCNINTNKTYQYIRGFGGIDIQEWQGYALSDNEMKTVFGNGNNQLGLTVLRVFVNPDKNQWNKAVKVAKYASEHGATVFATPWEPPSNLAESGGNNGKLHLPSRNYAAYAQHLNDFGTYMKNSGVDLYSISVQNEPDYAKEWTYWSPTETTNFLANYGDKITSTRVMSPETFQYGAWNNSRDYYNNILNNQRAFANTDVFATHFYGTPRNKMDFPALESCGKEIWMTEVYVPNSNANSANNWPEALEVAENIHNGLVVGNMSVYTWWYIKRSYSLIEQNGSNGGITKRGSMMGQYSKYVRPGDFRIDCTESPSSDLLISAYKHSDTQIEVVAINKAKSSITQEFNVNNREITNVDRYRSSGSEMFAKTGNMDHKTSSFFASLPAQSVSTFVITLKSDGINVPDNPNPGNNNDPITPDANGYYYHDTFENGSDNWEARGPVEPTLSGRHPYAGTNALLAQKRESAWNGLQKTLDTNTFKAGQSYSFSVCVDYEDGNDTEDFLLSMQYVDSSGTTKYAHLAEGTTTAGKYIQLANPSFKIPDDASSPILYVETASGSSNFYIDEAIVAKDGTKIDGPGIPVIETYTAPTVSYTPADNAVNLSWTAVDGAQSYGVCVYSNGSWTTKTETQNTSYVLNNLTAGTEYKVAIDTKINGSWKKDYSKAITVKPNANNNNNNSNLYPTVQTQVKDHKIGFKWSSVPGAEKYGIGVYQANKWVVKKQLDGSATSWTSPQVANGTYRLVVLAKVNGEWVKADVYKHSFYVTVS